MIGELYRRPSSISGPTIAPQAVADEHRLLVERHDTLVGKPVEVLVTASELPRRFMDKSKGAPVDVMVSEHEVHRSLESPSKPSQVLRKCLAPPHIASAQHDIWFRVNHGVEERIDPIGVDEIQMDVREPGDLHGGFIPSDERNCGERQPRVGQSVSLRSSIRQPR